jgi:hypothetical protein
LQERLLAKQLTTKKDLNKALAKAQFAFVKSELECKEAIEDHENHAAVRGAFVVFQRREFQEDVLRTAPHGERLAFQLHTCLHELAGL